MSPQKRIQKTFQSIRIMRHRTYRRIGLLQHRKKLDATLKGAFLILLGIVLFLTFFTKPAPELVTYTVPEAIEQIDTVTEDIHEEFDADEPVIEESGKSSLTELEQRAARGEITLKKLSLAPKETLSALLKKADVPTADRVNIADALGVLINLKNLKRGDTFLIFMDKEGQFLGLALHLKDTNVAAVLKESDGTFSTFSDEGRIEKVTERITGKIERTFSGSAKKYGLSDNVIAQITGALDGEIDFATDIKPDQQFDIIFEKQVTPGGLEIGNKQLLFVGLDAKGGIYRYVWMDKSKMPTYYDARGVSAQTSLYKRPVRANTRLTSGYGNRRHPVLLYEVFHSGVDLAAPMGTPVFAAGDGVITQLGRKGAYGKYIRIRHSSGYETAYGHLNGYRGDLKVGSLVKRGETIAYVGNTGRSTGPHLHFEVIKGGKTSNPFGTHVIAQKTLTGFELEQFQSFAEQLHPDFYKHLAGKIPSVPSPKPSHIK